MATSQANLTQLRDVHLPNPLSIWPPAPGWFLLAALILGAVIAIYFLIYRKWKKQAPKRFALKKLKELEIRYNKNKQTASIITDLSILLRRLALAYFPRVETAGLCGDEWLVFLNKVGNTNAFTDKIPSIISFAPYQKDPTHTLDETLIICRDWIKAVNPPTS